MPARRWPPTARTPLLDDAVRFVTQRLLDDGPTLRPAYRVDGGPVPDERSLDLSGYPGGTDVAGNHVNAQFQLDVFGESLLLLATAAGHDRLETDSRRAIEVAVRAIQDRWKEPDTGIWELDEHRWAQSRLICAAGLRSVAGPAATATQQCRGPDRPHRPRRPDHPGQGPARRPRRATGGSPRTGRGASGD